MGLQTSEFSGCEALMTIFMLVKQTEKTPSQIFLFKIVQNFEFFTLNLP